MSTGTQALQRSIPNQRAQSQLSISTGTRVLKGSMPNQWARSQQSISTGTQPLKGSMPNQRARSQLSMSTGTQALSDQYPTKGFDHNSFNENQITLINVIKEECLATNFHLDIYVTD